MAGCSEVLDKAREALSEFNPEIVEGRLVIYGTSGRLDFVFTAECTGEGKMLILTGIPGFFSRLPRGEPGRRILEALLDLAGKEYILVSKADENLLLAEPGPVEPSVVSVQRFFSLSALVVLWLTRQIESAASGGEVRPFSLDEIASSLGAESGNSGS